MSIIPKRISQGLFDITRKERPVDTTNLHMTTGIRLLLLTVACTASFASAFSQIGAPAPQSTNVIIPAFDVASVRQNKSESGSSWTNEPSDGYSARGVPLKQLIMNAYGIMLDNELSGLPKWTDSARFDIDAKMDSKTITAIRDLPGEQQRERRRLMLQALLQDRFRLTLHHESKELPMFALVVAKNGFKLKEVGANIPGEGAMSIGPGVFTSSGISISKACGYLSEIVQRPVADRTGITGRYNIALHWDGSESHADIIRNDDAAQQNESGTSIFTALQEQLGMKLESTKGPVDTIVVDHVEMPSAN